MMDCKRVLVEADGDLERAAELLRERGLVKARKKAGRTTSEGRVAASVSDDGRVAALIEVNCETDFVAKTDEYIALTSSIAEVARDGGAADVDALLVSAVDGSSVEERLTAAIAKLGENIQVRRLCRIEAPASGRVSSYIHAGGKIGAVVEVAADDPASAEVAALVRNLCMHVVASSPLGVSRDDLPADEVARERSALAAQAAEEGKPPEIVERMVDGRMGKFFKEVVLVEQPLVMDPDKTVEGAAKEAGARVVRFARFQLGEETA
jgi:elongation factor Ts